MQHVLVMSQLCVSPCCLPPLLPTCCRTLLPLFPEALVVPDTTQDARFKHLPFVAGPDNIRFYAGVPLLCKNGLRLGAL